MTKTKRIGYCALLGASIFEIVFCLSTMMYSAVTDNYSKAIWYFICGIGWGFSLAISWDKLHK